jgi:8-amino-7-oxononanoate synthase
MAANNFFGLSPADKARLIERLSMISPGPVGLSLGSPEERERLDPALRDSDRELELITAAARYLGIADPYFREQDGIGGAVTVIAGRPYDNFSSYDYLGLNGDPRIVAAAKAAVDRYGTSVSASRLASGERAIHRELERVLASVYGAEDSIAMVSGHATNVTVIGQLFGRDDVIVHDAQIHNSVVEGARLSGARRIPFRHLDADAADRAMREGRPRHGRILLAIEGHYSMDGDVPDLAAFIAGARRHRAWLMVDEAHALGVLGERGLGLAEHAGVDSAEVDIWMGTLSKSLVSCGGYIAGSRRLIDYLKRRAPGFVFSVGMPPPVAAAALAALEVVAAEPERVARLRQRATLFLRLVRDAGFDTGGSIGSGIVPVMTGSSIRAGRLADALFKRGINVQPILYPAVPERAARLRFFVTAAHDEAQLRQTAKALMEADGEIAAIPTDLGAVARHLGETLT